MAHSTQTELVSTWHFLGVHPVVHIHVPRAELNIDQSVLLGSLWGILPYCSGFRDCTKDKSPSITARNADSSS